MPPLEGGARWGDCQPVTIPNPAVGGGFTYRLPGSERQRILAVTFQLVASADVANRKPLLAYKDGGAGTFAAVGLPYVQTAGITSVYTFAVGLQQFGADDAANMGGPLPDLPLDVGETLVLTVTNVDDTDAVKSIRLFVEQQHVRDE